MSPVRRLFVIAVLLQLPLPISAQQPRTDSHGDPLPADAVARLGTVRFRHPRRVDHAAFSPDGKALAVASSSSAGFDIRLWEVATGRELRRFGDKAQHWGLFAYSPNGRLLAVGRPTGLQLWDVATGRLLHTVDVTSGRQLCALAFAPDGQTVAAAGGIYDDGSVNTIALLDVATGTVRRTSGGHANAVLALAFSADGKRLFSASDELKTVRQKQPVHVAGTLCAWDVATGKKVRQTEGAFSSPVCFAPDGSALASTVDEQTVCVHDVAAQKERCRIASRTGGNTYRFTPDGKVLAGTNPDGWVSLWDATTGRELRRLQGVPSGVEVVAAVAPDGKLLATTTIQGGCFGAVRLWELATGREVRPHGGHAGEVTGLVYSPDGKILATRSPDQTVRLWEADTGKELHVLRGHQDEITTLAYAPDGRTLASAAGNTRLESAAGDGSLRLWDTATGRLRYLRTKLPFIPVAATFVADGKRLTTAGQDGAIQIWDVSQGKEVRRFPGRPKGLAQQGVVGLSADGRMLALASMELAADLESVMTRLRLLRAEFGREFVDVPLRLPDDDPNSNRFCSAVAFSPDGRLLATSESLLPKVTVGRLPPTGRHTIRLWEVATGRVVRTCTALKDGASNVAFGLAFSPDGRTLASAHGQRPDYRFLDIPRGDLVLLWDVATGLEVGQLGGHTGHVTAVAFAPDGRRLASASADGTVLVWDHRRFVWPRPPGTVRLPAEKLEALWSDLASDDASLAHRAQNALIASARQAVPLLRERLKPAVATDPEFIGRMITDLASERFPVRQKAMSALERNLEAAEAALRKVLEGKPPLELRRRVEQLLEKHEKGALTAEQLRGLRALTVLEQAGTTEAQQLLETLAKGAPELFQTREAQATLRRLANRAR
jgi:WD40 repeat protein